MSRTAVANPEPFRDTSLLPRRFSVVSQSIFDRGRETIWDEYAQLHHPAWSDHPEGQGPSKPVGHLLGLTVGAATVTVLPTTGAQGIPGMSYSEVIAVVPGYSTEVKTIITGAFQSTETIRLLDHPEGGTHAQITFWVDTVPATQARAARLQHNLHRIQQGYLHRARNWRPGTPHRPNVIAPEPEDL